MEGRNRMTPWHIISLGISILVNVVMVAIAFTTVKNETKQQGKEITTIWKKIEVVPSLETEIKNIKDLKVQVNRISETLQQLVGKFDMWFKMMSDK